MDKYQFHPSDKSIEDLLDVQFSEPVEYSIFKEIAEKNNWEVMDYYYDEETNENISYSNDFILPISKNKIYYEIVLIRTSKRIEGYVYYNNSTDLPPEYYSIRASPEQMKLDIEQMLIIIENNGKIESKYSKDFSYKKVKEQKQILH